MKGLSVIFTLLLLVVTTQLAVCLKRARALPAQHEHRASFQTHFVQLQHAATPS